MRAHHSGSRIVSTIRYRDAAAAIDWLCDAFGFDRHLIVPALDGTVAHAQLVHGSGMVMIGTARDDEYGALVRPPDQSYDATTQGNYVIVADPDAHHDAAFAAGAHVVLPLVDQIQGGRAYTCRDPEGHVWTFGDYDPWQDD